MAMTKTELRAHVNALFDGLKNGLEYDDRKKLSPSSCNVREEKYPDGHYITMTDHKNKINFAYSDIGDGFLTITISKDED